MKKKNSETSPENAENKITLRHWIRQRITAAALSADTEDSLALSFKKLGAPQSILLLVRKIEEYDGGRALDSEFSCKQCFDGPVPDLEDRDKKRKRSTGQFYTPESLAGQLAKMVLDKNSSAVLDPACGDGSFLLALAGRLSEYAGFDAGNQSVVRVKASGHSFLNKLHGYDIDLLALFICLIRLITTFRNCGWPDLQQRDFLLNPGEGGFDLVIGNPPYRVNLEPEYKQQLALRYCTAEGEKDLYTFFMEAGLQVLRPDGHLLMLTSHTYLVNHQCRKIRELLFVQNQVEALLLLPERFFAMAPGVLPVITVVKRAVAEEESMVTIHADFSAANGWQNTIQAKAQSFVDGRGLRQSIVPQQLAQIFIKLGEGTAKLGEICKVGVGIQESQKRDSTISRFVSEVRATANHRPVLRGRELSPFRINWEGKYIDYGPHLAFAGCEKTFSGAKVLYQNIRNERLKQRLVAAFDQHGYFPKNSLSYILPSENGYSGNFLCGILNSSLINAWFSGNFHSFHITVTQVRQIPLPPVCPAAAGRVEELVKMLGKYEPGSADWNDCQTVLDQAVCECYLGSGDHSGLLKICDNFLEHAARL